MSQLMDNYPDTFVMVQYHLSDAYQYPFGDARGDFYGVWGIPWAVFDGVINRIGAFSYSVYESTYNTRRDVPTDVEIQLSVEDLGGDTYRVRAEVCVEQGGEAKSVRVYIVQVLDYWPAYPDYHRNGFKQAAQTEDLDLDPGVCRFVERDFTLDADSTANIENVTFVAWAQVPNDIGPAEVYQAAMIDYPFTPPNNFVPNNAYAVPGKGQVLSGGVEKLAAEDGDLWRQRGEVQIVTVALESLLVAETNVGPDPYTSGQVSVVMNATPPRPQACQYRVRAWDYAAGAWVSLGSGDLPADGSMATLTLPLTGDVNDFIDPTTRQMRVDVQAMTDKVTAGVLIHGIDLIRWELTP